jgi:hypothetical protein
VLQGREHICPAKELEVRFWAVGPYLLEKGLESNHEEWCLTLYDACWVR